MCGGKVMGKMHEDEPPSERVRVRRAPHKARYDFETITAILDAQPLAHLGVVTEEGWPLVFPTLHWRQGDRVYIHGARKGLKMRLAAGRPCCLTVAVLDGLRLARSAFNHSANYRSVMILAQPEIVPEAEKSAHLAAMIEAFFPGRNRLLRPMKANELKATTVLSFSLREASAKVSEGEVNDPPEDAALPIWAGVVPVSMQAGTPVADPNNRPGLAMPDHVIPRFLRRQ